jgi:6-pyruvoyl-tetrahydropterin synthase
MIKKWSEYITESFKKISHTEEDIYKYTLDILEDRINDLFVDVHGEFDTVSGDITPDQQFELNNLQEKIAKIIAKQVHQNLGDDFKKIRTSEIEVDQLKELDDERDSVKDGDEVIAVYFDGGYSIYKFKVSKSKYLIDYQSETDPGFGSRFDDNWYSLEDAYLVVKVGTYNDFVNPDKRL